MENANIAQKGEQLTFYKLFADKRWNVEIPIIQRDYAQGRKSAREVRETFLNTLHKHLKDNEKIDLDFIYGSLNGKDNELFIPLDGQQRLTTLFLLHWYLANKENMQGQFREFLVSVEGKSKFTYETRASAREFCDELVNRIIDFNILKESDEGKHNSLSKTIEDQNWYFLSWRNDPTIQAMLVMLDDIHKKFIEDNYLFGKLIDINNPLITFQFLNLEKFGLTDDLYIKMNARGKQLSAFENFKAKFEQHIKDLEINKTYQLQIGTEIRTVFAHVYFSHKIDTDWADLFWNYRNTLSNDNTFDDEVMNFIRWIITNHYALKGVDKDKVDNIQLLIGRDGSDNHLSYLQYKELGCLDLELVTDLIAIFDLLSKDGKAIKTYLDDNFYYDEKEFFKSTLFNESNYRYKIRFYAFYKYIIQNKSFDGLNDWMRVIYNLTENRIYDQPEDYINSLKFIHKLLEHSFDIISYLAKNETSSRSVHQIQYLEEIIKAHLIIKSDDWENLVLSAERHEYFTGQIGFLLTYSGIEDYYNQNFNLDWTESENNKYFSSFQDYSIKAKNVFKEKNFKNLNNYVWERALLTKGDYLLKEGSNLSFCTYFKDRDIGWKRLLLDGGKRNDYPDHLYRRNLVKDILDDDEFDISNLQNSLENIINKSHVSAWYKPFIDNYELFNYLGPKRYIRKESESQIYLIKSERMSGQHAELYSYVFYLNHLKNNDGNFSPFENNWYYSPSGTEEEPCAFIDNWHYKGAEYEIDIYYLPDEHKFEMYFFDNNNKNFNNVRSLLLQNDMVEIYEDNGFYYWKKENNEANSLTFLNSLCHELKKLVS